MFCICPNNSFTKVSAMHTLQVIKQKQPQTPKPIHILFPKNATTNAVRRLPSLSHTSASLLTAQHSSAHAFLSSLMEGLGAAGLTAAIICSLRYSGNHQTRTIGGEMKYFNI